MSTKKLNHSWTGDEELDELIDGKASDRSVKADKPLDPGCLVFFLLTVVSILIILGILLWGYLSSAFAA